jgi:uncharacterized protein involved in outer membrane biogenesis
MVRVLSLMLAALLALAVGAVWLVPPMLDWNQYRDDIAALVSANLGRAVEIKGPVSLSLLPEPVLTAGRVTVAEDHDGVTMAVSQLRVRLALMPLLGGRVDAQELVLRGLDMRLPWPLQQDRLVLQSPTWLSSISARVEGGRLSVGSLTMTGIDATLGLVPDTGSYALAGTAQISGLPWHLTARLTRIGGDGAAGLDMSLDGQGPVQGLGAMFSGQIAADGSLAGRISGRGPDLSRLLPAPNVPFKADGRLSIAGGLAVADELTAEIAGSPARGAVALRLEPETRLDVSITASRLDLDAWLPALLRSAGKQIIASIPTGIDLSAEAATLAGGTLRALRGRFELDPSMVMLNDVAAILPGDAQLYLSGQVRRVALIGGDAAAGRQDVGLHFEGTGALTAASLRTTLGWIEQAGLNPLSALPNDVLRSADLRAAITADTNPSGNAVPASAPQLVLTQLNGMVDQSHVQGSLTLRPGPRLGVSANLTFDRLALDPWLAGPSPGMTGLPTRIGRFDLDMQLRAEQASFRDQTLQPFVLDAALETGRLSLRRLEAQSAGARLVAAGVINDLGRIADARLDLSTAPDTASQVISNFVPALAPYLRHVPRGALALSMQAGGPPEALALRAIIDLGDLHAEAQPTLDLPGRKWNSALSLRHPGAPRLLDMLDLGGTAAWLGDGSLSWTGTISGSGPLLAPTRIASDSFDVSAGRLRASGALALDLAGTPKLTGRLAAETLPLPLPYPRSPDALQVAVLQGWQATVKLEANQVLAGLSPFLQQASANLSLNAGVVRLESLSARLEGGALTGAVTFDGETAPPRLNADLSLVSATPPGAVFELPIDLAGGSIDANANVSASGYSAAALLSTLGGTLRMSVHDGVLVGVDLAKAGPKLLDADLRAALAGGTTSFSEFNATAAFRNGAAVLTQAPFTAASGTGTLQGLLDIAGQTAELRLAVRPAVPDPPEIALRLSGPLAAPTRTPELADAQRWRLEHP